MQNYFTIMIILRRFQGPAQCFDKIRVLTPRSQRYNIKIQIKLIIGRGKKQWTFIESRTIIQKEALHKSPTDTWYENPLICEGSQVHIVPTKIYATRVGNEIGPLGSRKWPKGMGKNEVHVIFLLHVPVCEWIFGGWEVERRRVRMHVYWVSNVTVLSTQFV